jgi:hypothetical protein
MYSKMEKGEQAVARRLVKTALKMGYRVSVHDGVKWSPKFTTYGMAWSWLGEMDEDNIILFDANDNRVGWIFLVWGNEPDGSELIADHTSNNAIAAVVDAALKRKSGE